MQSNAFDFLVNLSARQHAARSAEEALEIQPNAMKRFKCIGNAPKCNEKTLKCSEMRVPV